MKHFSELSQSAERIVDAAENLVQQFGFNGFSFEDIAQLVGIRKPSIYHHFPSKQELVAVMTQRYTHRFCARLEDINAKYNGAVERLHAHAALFSETLGKEGRLCACGMLGAEHNSLPEPIRQQVKDFFACNVGADPNLSHRADRILSQGWGPAFRGPAVDKCRSVLAL